jgi:hypothetical protein
MVNANCTKTVKEEYAEGSCTYSYEVAILQTSVRLQTDRKATTCLGYLFNKKYVLWKKGI